MKSLSMKLRLEKLEIEKSVFSLRDYGKEIIGATAETIRVKLDSLQAKKREIKAKINSTENNIQLASENGNLSQTSVELYQRNLEDLNTMKRLLDKNFNDIYARIKLEYEKAVLFGRKEGGNEYSLDMGKLGVY